MSKKRRNSNYKYDPTPTLVEKKESRKAGFFGFILALVGIAACIIIAISMNAKSDTVYVEMKVKDYGTVVMELDGEAAPKTVENFVSLVESGFYDGLTFHRVIESFMIQGGCPSGNGTGGSGTTIKGEFSKNGYENPISHTRGTISMARGSHSYDSASSQFFICNADRSDLDGFYAAFGHVVEGMEVVDAITAATVGYTNDGGAISDKTKQAVIEYIKVLDGYTEAE